MKPVRHYWPFALLAVSWCAVSWCAVASAALSPAEYRMVTAINKYRADRQLPPLVADPILVQVARQRVDVFDHYHPRYGWVPDHARSAGFGGFATDNIAQGYESPEAAVGDAQSGWGNERQGHTVGHDMQMKGYSQINGQWVNWNFNRVGVAVSGRNYIAVFGTADVKLPTVQPRQLAQVRDPQIMELATSLREINRDGSCVHCSTANLMRWLRLTSQADEYRRRFGRGEHPSGHKHKLDAFGVKYAMTDDGDESLLEWAIANRRGAGVTWSQSHFINLVGRENGEAVLLGNGQQGRTFYNRQPWNEFIAEWKRRGGWAVVILDGEVPPPLPKT